MTKNEAIIHQYNKVATYLDGHRDELMRVDGVFAVQVVDMLEDAGFKVWKDGDYGYIVGW